MYKEDYIACFKQWKRAHGTTGKTLIRFTTGSDNEFDNTAAATRCGTSE